jgi:hypothetical protein
LQGCFETARKNLAALAEALPEEHTGKSFLELARSYDEMAEAEEALAALFTAP